MIKDRHDTVENVEISGPGVLLSEARKKNDLSIDYVADRLNFRAILVQNIESDIFDKSLPDTFNRGYLKNYAKLVGLSAESIIESYEKLNLSQENSTKMQSFSRRTLKQAENSMLMWITYLILAVFVGLTMMWWLQDNESPQVPKVNREQSVTAEQIILDTKSTENPVEKVIDEAIVIKEVKLKDISTTNTIVLESEIEPKTAVNTVEEIVVTEEIKPLVIEKPIATIFTFSGDCWVNIFDATGKRIAWGIKKAGYIMSVNGKLPLNITIGKPELVEINFNGESLDMSTFRQGHISKFTLPLSL